MTAQWYRKKRHHSINEKQYFRTRDAVFDGWYTLYTVLCVESLHAIVTFSLFYGISENLRDSQKKPLKHVSEA